MAVVLDLLEQTSLAASSGEDPDFELIGEIMRYMTIYPDAVHHPKEDVVYDELQKTRPDLTDGLDDVPADHREIAALGSRLRDDVEAIIAGAAVRRKTFVQDSNDYVRRLRQHMRWEEEDLFNRIDKMIGDDRHPIDVEEYQHIKDPVFELEIESAFRRLMASLKSDEL